KEAWKLQPVSPSHLALFLQNPLVNGPSTEQAILDTSGGTAPEMRDSLWNQALIHQFAADLHAMAMHSDDVICKQKDIEEWKRMAQDRIYRILVDV
ncbi:hypothetical protein EV361DRAFT_756406, partial [Lentinula raphanica]